VRDTLKEREEAYKRAVGADKWKRIAEEYERFNKEREQYEAYQEWVFRERLRSEEPFDFDAHFETYERARQFRQRQQARHRKHYTTWKRGGNSWYQEAPKSAADVRLQRLQSREVQQALALLGIKATSSLPTLAEVKAAYKTMTLKTHPDIVMRTLTLKPGLSPQEEEAERKRHEKAASDRFVQVQKAYELVLDVIGESDASSSATSASA